MEIDSELRQRIIETIDKVMKNQSKCDGGIDIDDPEVKKALMQNKGGFGRQLDLHQRRMVVTVKWNKNDLFFACSIAFLKKGASGKWHCETRFDDAHDCRHCDADFPVGKAKMFDGEFVLTKAECPILAQIINSLPKEKADKWKLNLFKEVMLGNKRKKEEFMRNKQEELKL